jgi:MerR family copper efflux transcriptional regulator
MKSLTIGALARAAGVKVETIRYYERRGLLRQPERPESGYRRYPPDAVKRVRFIKSAQKLGFSLREIQELLDLGSGPRSDCSEVLAITKRKIADVESKIKALDKIRSVLLELASHCPAEGNLTQCPIWERLESETEEEVWQMSKRKVEVFTAGCPVCAELVDLVKGLKCPDCDLTIYNLNRGEGIEKSKEYGVTAIPAVAVNGKLLDCCRRGSITKEDLMAAGIGRPI